MSDIVQKLIAGDRLALSRLITLVENQHERVGDYLGEIHPHLGRAYYVGITGPPGAGKSTLVNQLIFELRKNQLKVGVIAIDPSSPFTGGALLGDRIRMQDHAADSGVFIRSLGSRGAHGGLSRATRDVVRLMDAFGMDWVLIETVGVGQTELNIMELAHATVVVLTPESGDTIQTMKAGLLEVADIFVVNKSDRPGADKILHELKSMLEISTPKAWPVPVLKTNANQAQGIAELRVQLEEHRRHYLGSGEFQERQSQLRKAELEEILQEKFLQYWREQSGKHPELQALEAQVAEGELSAYRASESIRKRMLP